MEVNLNVGSSAPQRSCLAPREAMRRLSDLIAAAALVALLATLGLWAGGSRRAGTLRWPRGEARATFVAARGGGLYVVTSTVNRCQSAATPS